MCRLSERCVSAEESLDASTEEAFLESWSTALAEPRSMILWVPSASERITFPGCIVPRNHMHQRIDERDRCKRWRRQQRAPNQGPPDPCSTRCSARVCDKTRNQTKFKSSRSSNEKALP